jgi:lysophospholipase L1-like esterase
MQLFLKILSAVFVSLFLWEIILENTILHDTGSSIHPVLGRVHTQGSYMQGTEGYSRGVINSVGMRGPEIEEKADGEYRILTLGDSFTQALYLYDNQVYTHLLEKHLRSDTKQNITVINGGFTGASPAYYIHLADYFKQLTVFDFVVIQLGPGDFNNEIFDTRKNFFVANVDGEFTTKPANLRGRYKLIQKYPQLSFLNDLSSLSIIQFGGKNIERLVKKQKERENKELDTTPVIDWSLKTLQEKYPHVVILYIPETINLHGEDINIPKVEKTIEQIAHKYKIPLVNMRYAFSVHYQKTQQPAYGFNNGQLGSGHTNVVGHTLMAQELTSYFKREVLQ